MYQFRSDQELLGTVTIVGDSIMSGVREELLKTDKHKVKVRFFRGETIKDIGDSIKLEKRTGLYFSSCK